MFALLATAEATGVIGSGTVAAGNCACSSTATSGGNDVVSETDRRIGRLIARRRIQRSWLLDFQQRRLKFRQFRLQVVDVDKSLRGRPPVPLGRPPHGALDPSMASLLLRWKTAMEVACPANFAVVVAAANCWPWIARPACTAGPSRTCPLPGKFVGWAVATWANWNRQRYAFQLRPGESFNGTPAVATGRADGSFALWPVDGPRAGLLQRLVA